MAQGVPSNYVIPYIGVEFDDSQAFSGPATIQYKAILLGHQLANTNAIEGAIGLYEDNEPTFALNEDNVAKNAGPNSMLAQLANKHRARNKQTEFYVANVPMPTGNAAIYRLAITGIASEAGTFPFFIDGRPFNVGVSVGDTAAEILPKLLALIEDAFDETTFYAGLGAVTTTAGADVVDNAALEDISDITFDATAVLSLIATYTGVAGNEHDIRDKYYKNDRIPNGLTPTITRVADGTGSPDITAVIAGMNNQWFQGLLLPWTDQANLTLMKNEWARRFGPDVQMDGMSYSGYADTASNTIDITNNSLNNSPSMVLVDAYRYTQHPMYVAAYVMGACMKSVQNLVSQPLHRITIPELLPPVEVERYDNDALNTLTQNGVCTLNPNSFGGPQTFGMVTMYLKNSAGVNSLSYRKQTTLHILQFLRYDLRVMFASKYPRAILADSAERIRPGIQVMTPGLAKEETIAKARQWEENALVENVDEWKDDIVYQRNAQNPDRLDGNLGPDLVNQFIVGSNIIAFKLQ